MKRILLRRLAFLFGLGAAVTAMFAFYGSALQSIPAVQQLLENSDQICLSCLDIYRKNPTIAAFLIASAVGIPAGLALSMIWPRNGILHIFERHVPVEDPRT